MNSFGPHYINVQKQYHLKQQRHPQHSRHHLHQQQYLHSPPQPYPQQYDNSVDRTGQPEHLEKEMERVKTEYPNVYQMIQDQQSFIEEQKISAAKASSKIRSLEKKLSSLWDYKKKLDDKIPPVIHVDKVIESSSCDDDTAGLDSSKKRLHSNLHPAMRTGNVDNQENTHVTDVDAYESLPLKKRMKRQQENRPDIAKAIATLKAATSPSFSSNEQLRTFLF